MMVLYNRELLVSFPYLRLEDGAWERDYIKYPDWTQIHCELYIKLYTCVYMYIMCMARGIINHVGCKKSTPCIAIAASHYDISF